MPALLRALSRTSNPDTAFVRFDQFLTKLGAGVRLFSMLYSNPGLLDLLAGICGTAPRLASYLAQNATVLEAVVDPDFFTMIPDRKALHENLEASLGHARNYTDVLDFARDRKSVVKGKSVSVLVGLGGRGCIKKKKSQYKRDST